MKEIIKLRPTMETVIFTSILIATLSTTLFFLFIAVRQAVKENRYYSHIAEEHTLYYNELYYNELYEDYEEFAQPKE